MSTAPSGSRGGDLAERGDDVDDGTVLVRREGRAGHITLNRPAALNALTPAMVARLHTALTAFEEDDQVGWVVLTGAGERGLCAGGDIRFIRADALVGGQAARAFWRAEYRLNARIARYPKPYLAVMDGIVMGGGVGLSAHGTVRVVTERSTVAMPETTIGFVPDVGGSWLLARAPGEVGTHLALTAGHATAGDALAYGLADHYVPTDRVSELLSSLATMSPDAAVRAVAAPAPPAALAAHRHWIDDCYAADTAEEVVRRLLSAGVPTASAAAERLRRQSPTAVKVTLSALRRARGLASLEEAIAQEYRVSCAALAHPDLAEGVRARIVDKDRTPRWSPSTLEAVSDATVAGFFAERDGDEIDLAAR